MRLRNGLVGHAQLECYVCPWSLSGEARFHRVCEAALEHGHFFVQSTYSNGENQTDHGVVEANRRRGRWEGRNSVPASSLGAGGTRSQANNLTGSEPDISASRLWSGRTRPFYEARFLFSRAHFEGSSVELGHKGRPGGFPSGTVRLHRASTPIKSTMFTKSIKPNPTAFVGLHWASITRHSHPGNHRKRNVSYKHYILPFANSYPQQTRLPGVWTVALFSAVPHEQ